MDDFFKQYESFLEKHKAQGLILEEGFKDIKRKIKALGLEKGFKRSELEIIDSLSTSSEYPYGKSLLEKFKYYEAVNGKAWGKRQIHAFIEANEGNKRSLRSYRQNVSKYIKQYDLISFKLNNSLKYTYYTTRKDWVDTEDGKLIEDYLPDDPNLKQLLSNDSTTIAVTGFMK